jgi:DNA polymerase/3'-5' exonuclease PolX
MINEEIADIFEKMSRVLAFKGANRFRTLAYERAAPLAPRPRRRPDRGGAAGGA